MILELDWKSFIIDAKYKWHEQTTELHERRFMSNEQQSSGGLNCL